MKQTSRSLGVLLVCILATTTLFAAIPPDIPIPPDPAPGTPGNCNYCSDPTNHCYCAAPAPGMRLATWECTCSSTTCNRICVYAPV